MSINRPTGTFCIDRNGIIQGQYSYALEQILATTHLEGRCFIDLLAASVQDKEKDTLKDYFDMIFSCSFAQDILDSINPLHELSYYSVESKEKRDLCCSFTLIEQENGNSVIQGTIVDISAERELQSWFKEKKQQPQGGMPSLFEVIPVEPKLFKDFIEDAEYEFDQIHKLLTGVDWVAKAMVVDVYQAIHAIKANAIILGLESFGRQVHNLELKLKRLQWQDVISDEDMNHLTGEIQELIGEKDKLSTAVNKLQIFSGNEEEEQKQNILVKSLTWVCNKVAEALNKKLHFVVEEIDNYVLECKYQRIIKEILMQLVRNAVYHGIESPAERISRGKDETGTIKLAITLQEGKIHLYLEDDGRGIDFDRIQEKAVSMHILEDTARTDKDVLLQIIFRAGFSTAKEEGIHAGQGIGLNLVWDRVHELQGTIDLQSEHNKGTVFNVFIPLEEA